VLGQELLINVVTILDRIGAEYMLTGSYASSLQGEPRSTHDIDIVIDLHPSHIPALLQCLSSPHYYLSESAVRDAVQKSTMFNLVEVDTSEKVDFWLLTDEPFDRSRFARRCREEVAELQGLPVTVSSPEDTILAKLRWAKLSGGSEKQFVDALRVYELQHPTLDLEYLEQWVPQLEILELWQRLRQDARPVEPEE
ncbi:MAG: nucleotidyltransferase domain-containing protein, partial [Planctomycetaceae bacterium]